MPSFGPYESLAEYKEMTGITYENYINSGLVEPSGIDIINDRLIVSDHSNGDIILYDVSGASPNELGKIQTGSAGIMGIKIGPKGNIWYVNGQNNEVHKLTPNSLSIKETTLNNLSIYPNPSDGTFILEGHTLSGYQISITDLLGQKILEDHKELVEEGERESQESKEMQEKGTILGSIVSFVFMESSVKIWSDNGAPP